MTTAELAAYCGVTPNYIHKRLSDGDIIDRCPDSRQRKKWSREDADGIRSLVVERLKPWLPDGGAWSVAMVARRLHLSSEKVLEHVCSGDIPPPDGYSGMKRMWWDADNVQVVLEYFYHSGRWSTQKIADACYCSASDVINLISREYIQAPDKSGRFYRWSADDVPRVSAALKRMRANNKAAQARPEEPRRIITAREHEARESTPNYERMVACISQRY